MLTQLIVALVLGHSAQLYVSPAPPAALPNTMTLEGRIRQPPGEHGQEVGCRIKSPKRSDRAKREYRQRFPCPVTGVKVGACPGWDLDHIVPLCCGGADEWWNLRWMERDLHKMRHADGMRCDLYPPLEQLPPPGATDL